jgi:hypothetical protein
MKKAFTVVGIFSALLLIFCSSFAQTAKRVENAARVPVTGPLGFIENKGQYRDQDKKEREDLLFLFERKGIKVQLMPNTISFELYTMEADPASFDEAKGLPHYEGLDPEDRPTPKLTYKSSRIDVEFIGANPSPEIITEEMRRDYLNYYLSFTPTEGIRNVKQYNKIIYKNLYNNIDLVLIATPDQNPTGSLAYDFIVHPGGDVKDIRYRYHGTSNQNLLEDGTLETWTAYGKIAEMIPESYLQNKAGTKAHAGGCNF